MCIRWIAAFAFCLLCGCASPRVVVSPPPAIALEFADNLAFGEPDSRVLLPKGRYLPVREDKNGFYFKAPEMVIVKDERFGPEYRYEGGVYWRKDEDEPSRVYVKTIYGPMKIPVEFTEYSIHK